jgi:hypothetical protein
VQGLNDRAYGGCIRTDMYGDDLAWPLVDGALLVIPK